MFNTTHKLDFYAAPWEGGIKFLNDPTWYLFKVGTCHGLWCKTDSAYEILAIKNDFPGNGHLQDVFEWFENSCKRDKVDLIVREIWNQKFKIHLLTKRGFVPLEEEDAIKKFT